MSTTKVRFVILIIVFIGVCSGLTPQANAAGLSSTTLKWTTQTADGAGGWSSIAWSPDLNIFVAVGKSSFFPNATVKRLMTSTDGKTWTLVSDANLPASPGAWTSVTWSPALNLFVVTGCRRGSQSACFAGGNNLLVMTSPNGSDWTERTTTGGSSTWQSVAWSPELDLFIAVADTGDDSIMSSTDGITWTARTAPEDNAWNSVIWSSELNLFVSVAASGTSRVMTSPDGLSWTAQTAAEANTWTSVVYSPELDLLVAVASDGTNRVMTSQDGITWTARAASAANTWSSVTWSSGLGRFVAVANSGTDRVMTSSDGITWTGQAASVDNSWNAVTWSPGVNAFVAVASTGGSGVTTPRAMTGAIATSTTNDATNVATTTATLNGDYQDSFVGSGVNVFFRYRLAGSSDPYTETTLQATTSAGSFTADISGLTPDNTIYEYKAVLQWPGASTTQTLEGGLQTFATDNVDPEPEEEESNSSGSSSGGVRYGCEDPNATNYKKNVRHKQDKCQYASGSETTLTPASTSTSTCPRYTFARNLRKGDEGEDVRALQQTLNCLGFVLATSGPGAPGEETRLFRDLTHAAVIRFQEAYASEILAPLNLIVGSGYFAERTRVKIRSILGE